MKPVRTANANVVYKGPDDTVGDLWVERIRPHHIKITFEPTEEERQLLINGGRVTVELLKEPIPPIGINAITKEESEPVGEHGWKIDVEPGDVIKAKEAEGNGSAQGHSDANEVEQGDHHAPQEPTYGEEADTIPARAHGDGGAAQS